MHTLPENIRVGMNVYDSRHNHIGKIDDLRFPENAIDPSVEPGELDAADRDTQPNSIVGAIAEAFSDDDMPEVLRERLLHDGYIRIDADGLFASDRYILPEQIASASGDELTLNVEKDALLKRH